MKKLLLSILILYTGLSSVLAQSSGDPKIFPATPNPAEDKCLVRMYLPDTDEKAELRLVGSKSDNVVRTIPIGAVKGIQSEVVTLTGLPTGNYTCQLFYKGIVTLSTVIYHSVIDRDIASFDSVSVFKKMTDLQARIKTLESNITVLRDYNFHLDSNLTAEKRAPANDSLNNRLTSLNRDVVHLRLKLESFEQLMRELAILKVRNKLSDNPMRTGNTYTLTRIYFTQGSNDFAEKSTIELNDLVEVLNEFPRLTIKIRGHSDNTGNYGANIALSKERAKSVYSYLIQKGIDGARVSYDGYGSTLPLTENITDDDKAINRRVDFMIVKE